MLSKKSSENKKALIDKTISDVNYNIGEHINVLNEYGSDSDVYLITGVEKEYVLAHRKYDKSKKPQKITLDKISSKNIFGIGANPFDDDFDSVRTVNFTLSSILFTLNLSGEVSAVKSKYVESGVEISELCWNPIIIDKDGNVKNYQRDFVWTLEDKRNLIDSIYNGIDCGKILVRKRGFVEIKKLIKMGVESVAFNDIVDGKQRLSTLSDFIRDEFCDNYGNFFSDLSHEAQHKFGNNQCISYAEMGEDTPDNVVVKQFLKMNFAGVIQSKEHIDFVKSLKV